MNIFLLYKIHISYTEHRDYKFVMITVLLNAIVVAESTLLSTTLMSGDLHYFSKVKLK